MPTYPPTAMTDAQLSAWAGVTGGGLQTYSGNEPNRLDWQTKWDEWQRATLRMRDILLGSVGVKVVNKTGVTIAAGPVYISGYNVAAAAFTIDYAQTGPGFYADGLILSSLANNGTAIMVKAGVWVSNLDTSAVAIGTEVFLGTTGNAVLAGAVVDGEFQSIGRTANQNATGTIDGFVRSNFDSRFALPAMSGANLTNLDGGAVATGVVDPARLGTGAGITTKFLRGDGTWQTISGGGDALTSNPLSQFASTTSAQLRGVLSDETGTGAAVFANGCTLVAPLLGTPASGVLTNCTGLPISTGVNGLAANVATWLATPSSANLAAAVTDETGTGALVFANGCTLVAPLLGTPASGNLSNCTALNATQLTSGTVPSARLDLASSANAKAATDTAKPLTSSNLNDYTTPQTLTDAATVAFDTALGVNAKVTLGGNRTLGAPSNLRAGASGQITITQDGTGGRTLAYNAVWKFVGGSAPVLSTAAGAIDLLSWYYDGTTLMGNLNKGWA